MMVRYGSGILFLFAQVLLVAHSRFVPSRWLCWAPNDYAVEYRLRVTSHSRDLSPSEIQARYHVAEHGWYENPPENIMDIVRQYEQTEAKGDTARVQLIYRLDGGQTKEWRWPEQH